jgi:hypothetical protein
VVQAHVVEDEETSSLVTEAKEAKEAKEIVDVEENSGLTLRNK